MQYTDEEFDKISKSFKPAWTEKDWENLEKFKNSPEYDIILQNITQKMFRENFGIYNPSFQPKNLVVEEEKKLNDKVKQLQDELVSIQYENRKLNSQITTLNKVIDSDLSELDNLRTPNKRLEEVNKTLENNNAHYWRNTILISLGSAIFGAVLGVLSSQIKIQELIQYFHL